MTDSSPDRCLGCQHIDTHPVTLLDGTVVCSTCEAWRAECEARMLLDRFDLNGRREYLAHVQRKRGDAALQRLKALILQVWEARRQ